MYSCYYMYTVHTFKLWQMPGQEHAMWHWIIGILDYQYQERSLLPQSIMPWYSFYRFYSESLIEANDPTKESFLQRVLKVLRRVMAAIPEVTLFRGVLAWLPVSCSVTIPRDFRLENVTSCSKPWLCWVKGYGWYNNTNLEIISESND